MGYSKTANFSEEQNEMAALAKALGHPARIAILQYLMKINSCVCGDIVDQLPLSQSTVSQHLKELKKVNLIHGVIEGPSICYCINTEAWNNVKNKLSSFFGSLAQESTCC